MRPVGAAAAENTKSAIWMWILRLPLNARSKLRLALAIYSKFGRASSPPSRLARAKFTQLVVSCSVAGPLSLGKCLLVAISAHAALIRLNVRMPDPLTVLGPIVNNAPAVTGAAKNVFDLLKKSYDERRARAWQLSIGPNAPS